jgi:diguanylate cyclase (GGDEF)-like protein
LIIYYTDISFIKQDELSLFNNNTENKIYYLKDRDRLLYKDKLTGLYNKNFFEEELARLDTKRQLPISIIMGDINGLKLINDAFGHNMGDRVLKKAAEIMTSSFRDEDIISRVGGDEFVILLPTTMEKTALEIVERVKMKCANNPLEYIKINISFGVATKTFIDEDINKIYKKAEDRMYFNKLKESKEAKLSMIKFLKNRLEKITYETKSHYDRLKELTMIMAEALDLSEIEKEELRLLCEFHDIGKIGVSKNILQKEDRLNNEEWENVKRHSEIGYYIAKEFKDASSIDELILTHHERWDGKGYPGLLKNDEIPLVARIFALADAYDVMVNDRPFQTRMTKNAALKEIKEQSGRQFDPVLAEVFINLMSQEKLIV